MRRANTRISGWPVFDIQSSLRSASPDVSARFPAPSGGPNLAPPSPERPERIQKGEVPWPPETSRPSQSGADSHSIGSATGKYHQEPVAYVPCHGKKVGKSMSKPSAARTISIFILWSGVAACLALTFYDRGDLLRQKNAADYLHYNANPFRATLSVLHTLYGTDLPRDFNLWSLPPVASEIISSNYGNTLKATEATYPPHALPIFLLVTEPLKEIKTLTIAWSIINILCVLYICRRINALQSISDDPTASQQFYVILLYAVLFFPFLLTVHHSQFSVIILACLLYAYKEDANLPLAALALTVSMIKPSVMLPFVALFLDKKHLPKLMGAIVFISLLAAYVSLVTHENVVTIHKQWMEITLYFNFNKHWTSWASSAQPLKFIVLFFCLAIVFALSRLNALSPLFKFSAAGVFSMLYSYHSTYDYVMLFPYFCLFAPGTKSSSSMPAFMKKIYLRFIFFIFPFIGISTASMLQLLSLSRIRQLDAAIAFASRFIWKYCTISLLLAVIACLVMAAPQLPAWSRGWAWPRFARKGKS